MYCADYRNDATASHSQETFVSGFQSSGLPDSQWYICTKLRERCCFNGSLVRDKGYADNYRVTAGLLSFIETCMLITWFCKQLKFDQKYKK